MMMMITERLLIKENERINVNQHILIMIIIICYEKAFYMSKMQILAQVLEFTTSNSDPN